MVQANTRSVVEAGIMAAVAIIFALISAYIPVVGVFVNLFWPVPIILLGIRHGFKWSVMATVVAGVIITILMEPIKAVSIVVGFGLIGIVLGHAFRADFSPAKTILWGSLASLVSKVAVIGIGIVVTGINPLSFPPDVMDKALAQVVGIYRGMGVPAAAIAQIEAQMKVMLKLLPIIMPGAFVLAAIVDTYLNFVVARAVLRKLGHRTRSFPPFKEWTLPPLCLYAYVLGVAMIYFGQQPGRELLHGVGINLWMIASILLLVQGLALFYYLADKYSLSRLMRNIILVLIISNGFLAQVVIFAGAFDMALDYRQLRTPRSS